VQRNLVKCTRNLEYDLGGALSDKKNETELAALALSALSSSGTPHAAKRYSVMESSLTRGAACAGNDF